MSNSKAAILHFLPKGEVGEAVMAPVSVSLVSDYFPQNKQGKPMGIISGFF